MILEMLTKPTCAMYLKNYVQMNRLLHSTPIRIYADFHTSFHSKLCLECHQQMYSFGDARYPLSNVSRSQHGEVCTGCSRMFGPYKTAPILKEMIKMSLKDPNSIAFCGDLPTSSEVGFENLIKGTRRHMQRRLKKKNKSDMDQIPSFEELQEFFISSNTCALTGIRASWYSSTIGLNIDHIIPISKGGQFGIMNVQPTMNFVNAAKGNESNLEVLRWLAMLKESIQG